MASLFLLSAVFSIVSTSTIPQLAPRSELNGPCNGANSVPGICVPTESCTRDGGSFISNACPGTPENIKCCTKPKCGPENSGTCSFVSSCASGITERNFCPGPADFRCCMPSNGGMGSGGVVSVALKTGPQPELPTDSGCKRVAVQGAKTIIDAFPGQVKEIGCTRKCADPGSSDHCQGMATDMMVNLSGVITSFLIVVVANKGTGESDNRAADC